MRNSVLSAFYRFNAPMEGEVPFFYQDVKGYVSIGVGILADPFTLAIGLPMVHAASGQVATREEILEEWQRIKNLPPRADGMTAAQLGHRYAAPHCRLRLTNEGLVQTMLRKLHENQRTIVAGFPAFETWPADAQLGALSLAWGVGPAYYNPNAGRRYFPKLTAALRAGDFVTASEECFMPEESKISGLIPRNKANRTLFLNAAIVVGRDLDRDTLYYPKDLTVAALPTQPSPPSDDAPIVHPIPDMPAPQYDFDPPPDSDDVTKS